MGRKVKKKVSQGNWHLLIMAKIKRIKRNGKRLRSVTSLITEYDPVIDPNTEVGKRKLSDELDQQIRPVNCFLVIAGIYANHKYWIQKEVEIAQSYGKPIVGLIPWGQERTPTYIQETADIMVAWNTISIVQAIRDYAL